MEKIILFLCIILLLLSCDEQEEDNFRFYNWESVQDKIYNDSLILELGIDLNNYDGIILNELNYNLFGDGELYRNSLYMYFNYENNSNSIKNIKLNYSKLEEGVFKNNFYSLNYFKSDEFYNNISFFNNDEKVNLDIKNLNRDYSIILDTLESDYSINYDNYNFDNSGLFLSFILKLNYLDFDMISRNKYFTIFNEDNTTLSLNSLKSEIEKYYTLNDTVAFVFESHHIKFDTIHQNNKKYIIFNKEIYPIRLTYLP